MSEERKAIPMETDPKLCDVCPTPDCGAAWAKRGGTMSTLVWHSSPPGHDHDDNCLKRVYVCKNGHDHVLSARRRCPTDGCTWIGKSSCFDTGEKLDRWPTPDVQAAKGLW